MEARGGAQVSSAVVADAIREDPIGSGVAMGWDQIRAAFAGARPHDGTTVDFAYGDVRGAGPAVAFPFTYTATAPDGSVSRQQGIDVLTVDDDGLTASLVAYWGAEDAG